MHRSILLVLSIILIGSLSQLFGQELSVKNFKEEITDISARENQVLDLNGDPCALVKIYTGVTGFEIDGNRGIEKREAHTGVEWIWLPAGTSQLKLSKEGMPMFVYRLPTELQTSTVYTFELSSDQLFSIIINTGNVDATVFINDSTFRTNTTVPGLAEKDYPIRIEKLGYRDIEDTITVNESNLYFAYTLVRSRQDVLKINSDPPVAVVLMDGEHVGYTDFSGYYFPGQYHLQITLRDYITIDTIIVFDPAIQSTFDFKLIKNTGWLKTVISPANTDIAIDGVADLPGIREINAGSGHNIIVSRPRYRTVSEAFTVPIGDTLLVNIALQHEQGDFSLVVSPGDANIKLSKEEISIPVDNQFEEVEWNGDTLLNMPAGQYSLVASRKGYVKTLRTLVVNDEKTTFLSITLNPKKLERSSAIGYSVIFPGLGQFYSQRNGAGAGFLAAGLLSSAATGYYIYKTESLAKDYNASRTSYLDESDIGLIPSRRDDMDGAYLAYLDAAEMRKLCIGITAGIWVLNIADAAIFTKMYEPVLQGSIGEKGSYRLAASPGISSIGASFSLRF